MLQNGMVSSDMQSPSVHDPDVLLVKLMAVVVITCSSDGSSCSYLFS